MSDLTKEEIEIIKESIPKRIGMNIKKYRIQKGIKQSELAAMIQSDRQYQYKIESGIVGISVVKLALIAAALDVSISELVCID
jgi:transcriptional regulator with XRE-family HTH domain